MSPSDQIIIGPKTDPIIISQTQPWRAILTSADLVPNETIEETSGHFPKETSGLVPNQHNQHTAGHLLTLVFLSRRAGQRKSI